MICNISRLKGIKACERKEYNREVLRLEPLRTAEPLMTGASYHAGTAHLFATGDMEGAVALTEQTYRDALAGQTILAAEMPLIEREILVAKTAVRKYAQHYSKEDFTVLMPEVAFCISIPNTLHHCWYAHKLLYGTDTNFEHPECVSFRVVQRMSGVYLKCYCGEEHSYEQLIKSNWKCQCGIRFPRCYQPHYLKGRADALLSWKNMVWIFEQKTSGLYTDNWWRQWLLDIQLTGYTYGVSKATGIRPAGVLLNKIRKPRKNEDVHKWMNEDIFEREAFLRSDADLARFEQEFARTAGHYESVMRLANPTMNTDACFDWNRACYFHETCINHNEINEGQFHVRPNDYVEDEYYTLLNIPNPKGATNGANSGIEKNN